jgi:hypothetical protein
MFRGKKYIFFYPEDSGSIFLQNISNNLFFYSEDDHSMFLLNISNDLPDHIPSHSIKQESSGTYYFAAGYKR